MMIHSLKTPARFQFLFWMTAAFLGLSLVSRLGLTLMALASTPLSVPDLLYAFSVGLLYDLASFSHIALPVALWLSLFPQRWLSSPLWRGAGLLMRLVSLAAMLVLGASEWVFWEEFESRFNFIAVDYLVYTNEVIGNIRESYPLASWLSLCALAAAALTWLSLRLPQPAWLGRLRRLPVLGLLVLLVALVSVGLNGQMKNQRDNRYANELAGSGLYSLFFAFRHNELDYKQFYVSLPRKTAGELVRAQLTTPEARFDDNDPLDLRRTISHEGPEKHLNVVLISVESLSGEYLDSLGLSSAKGLTPHLDQLASEGMLFTRLYATGNRTVRGLEALSLSVPPTPGQSIVRRPNNDGLFSLASVFNAKGYSSTYLYGGYGTFDNMSEFFGGNGYEVKDRLTLSSDQITQENIWGVADEDLFAMTLRNLDRQHKTGAPFFAHVMTTSNHRPYTYPEHRIDIPSGSGRDGAVKYTDWAIGDFIRQARQHAWFKDTLFVIVADHCASSAGKTDLPVERYHIPLIIWSPEHIPARKVERLMSQIDIAPTLLGLLNFSYESQFMGVDVFATPTGPQRAFIATYQGLGYLKDDQLTVLMPQKAPETRPLNGQHLSAAAVKTLQDEAVAWYQVASERFSSGLMRVQP